MTKGSAIDIVRRRLNERVADDLTDTEIVELLNEAMKLVQKEVIKVDAYAFMSIAIHDTRLGSAGELYPMPNGMWYEFEVGYKATAAQSSYVRLARGNYHEIREGSESATTRYARFGYYFALWPNPTVAVTAGLRIAYMPTLSVGGDDVSRNTIIPIHPALHMAVVAWATMLALGDTMESRTDLATELATYLRDIPEWYHRGGDPQTVRLALNRDA